MVKNFFLISNLNLPSVKWLFRLLGKKIQLENCLLKLSRYRGSCFEEQQ